MTTTPPAPAGDENGSEASAADLVQRMMSMITGYWVTQIVGAAAELRIADYLAGENRLTAGEVAERASSDSDTTARLLRACASLGLVTYDGEGRFGTTPLFDTLRSDSPVSLRPVALVQGEPSHWAPWSRFPTAVREGRTQVKDVLGVDAWFEHFRRNPAEAALFSQAMTSTTGWVNDVIAGVIDTSSASVVADIGGAEGALLHLVMKASPGLRGVIFDVPDIAPAAMVATKAAGLADRCSVVEGDFFESVPAADLYLLKFILHDWDDTSALKILKSCRDALLPGGKIAVIEMHIGEIGVPGLGPLMDMHMLALGGQERDLEEYDALFAAAGLRRVKATPVLPYTVIEAVAV
ncbi:MAG TPA: methyltransferase [Streptosporangiaceae bacterium]